MLFQENGENIGMLSADCVEADLAERVKELFDTEHVLTVTYNLKKKVMRGGDKEQAAMEFSIFS